MKVILRSDLDRIGKRGDIIDVADGYGRNYLLPRGLAIRATEVRSIRPPRCDAPATCATPATGRRRRPSPARSSPRSSRSAPRRARKAACSDRSRRPTSPRPCEPRPASTSTAKSIEVDSIKSLGEHTVDGVGCTPTCRSRSTSRSSHCDQRGEGDLPPLEPPLPGAPHGRASSPMLRTEFPRLRHCARRCVRRNLELPTAPGTSGFPLPRRRRCATPPCHDGFMAGAIPTGHPQGGPQKMRRCPPYSLRCSLVSLRDGLSW